jgi:uncharacterized Tic20 family protein
VNKLARTLVDSKGPIEHNGSTEISHPGSLTFVEFVMSYGDVPAGAEFADQPLTVLTSQEKTWGMLCHLSTLLSYVAVIGIVGLSFIAPLVCWLIKKDTSKFVDYHGKESLNFQLNVLVYTLIGFALIPCFFIGAFVLAAVHIYNPVCVIIASIKANHGELFRYPFIFRLIK